MMFIFRLRTADAEIGAADGRWISCPRWRLGQRGHEIHLRRVIAVPPIADWGRRRWTSCPRINPGV